VTNRPETDNQAAIKNLRQIPGVGKSIARDLMDIGIRSVDDLIGKDPEELFHRSNIFCGNTQDPCILYVFRCDVYYANTEKDQLDDEKLKWWNWKNA